MGASNLSKDHSFNLNNVRDLHKNNNVNENTNTNGNSTNKSVSSIESIELVRRDRDRDSTKSNYNNQQSLFQSPTIDIHSRSNSAKRMASLSGKKGMDTQRQRLDHDDSDDDENDGVGFNVHMDMNMEDVESPLQLYENFSQQVNELMSATHLSQSPGMSDEEGTVSPACSMSVSGIEEEGEVEERGNGRNKEGKGSRSSRGGDGDSGIHKASFLEGALQSQSPIPKCTSRTNSRRSRDRD